MTREPPTICDFLVFGGGVAGLVAALAARAKGLDVVLCEKSEVLGGTAATSGGTLWLPGNHIGAAGRQREDAEAALRYMEAEIGARDEEVRKAFLDSGPQALLFLEQRVGLRFTANRPYPDYHTETEGSAEWGRAVTPAPFDGRLLGTNFGLVRPPMDEYMVLGGMMVARSEIAVLTRPWSSWRALARTVGIVARHGWDRLFNNRGTRLHLGNALIAGLVLRLVADGVTVLTSCRLVGLDRAGGRVEGADVEIANRTHRIAARKGVMLATGGFAADADLSRRYLGAEVAGFTATCSSDTGDGLRAALNVGAALDEDHVTPAFWMPASRYPRPDGTTTAYPHIRDRAKPGLIAVDRHGRRFVNESASYHDVTLAMLREHRGEQTFLICDRSFVRRYGLGPIHPTWQNLRRHVRSGYLFRGDTLPALAKRLDMAPETLVATVDEHNGFSRDGVDRRFGKGSTFYNRFNGDVGNRPNPCLAPIEHPPFFAVEVFPCPIGTSLGLATDADASVLGDDGRPIPGLYAGGSDMSSLMRGQYLGPGITLGPHVAFAYRAAMHATGHGR